MEYTFSGLCIEFKGGIRFSSCNSLHHRLTTDERYLSYRVEQELQASRYDTAAIVLQAPGNRVGFPAGRLRSSRLKRFHKWFVSVEVFRG